MSGPAAAFAAAQAIRAGEWDSHISQIDQAVRDRLATLRDRSASPPKTQAMLASGHQVWAWMNGPGVPHWEVVGTGARFI